MIGSAVRCACRSTGRHEFLLSARIRLLPQMDCAPIQKLGVKASIQDAAGEYCPIFLSQAANAPPPPSVEHPRRLSPRAE
jgi:hypothetical protein